MTAGTTPLGIVREQLEQATAAKKCHGCGCFQQTVSALFDARVAELDDALAVARASFVEKTYDCLGCEVCFPAVAANAFSEAFPERGALLELCPTEAPVERAGWPPLPGDVHVVRYAAAVAVCALNSSELAAELGRRAPARLAIAGTMHTENLGIERLVRNLTANPHVRVLIVCGADTQQVIGHLPGQSLLALAEHGIDERGRILGARGKRPVLRNLAPDLVTRFRAQVRVVDRIGVVDVDVLSREIERLAAEAPGPLEGASVEASDPVIRGAESAKLVPDPAGYLVVYPDAGRGLLRVEHFTNAGVFTCAVEAKTPAAVVATVVERALISRLDHAAYLGRELARAERSLETGEPYVQDRAPGGEHEPSPSCGCGHPCGGAQ